MRFLQHLFIVNPAAGKGRALNMIEKIKARFSDIRDQLRIEITNAPGHATAIARQASALNVPIRIYSVGGDGTLNEIINGIQGEHIELGILPCGSGNDAARTIYSFTDPHKLLEILPQSPSYNFDLGKANDKYFINIASVGFDAEVNYMSQYFKRLPFIPGSLAYILGVLTTLLRLKKYRVSIKADTIDPSERDILLCLFANGKYYGGGMKPAPRADMTDGLLDVCAVKGISRFRILRFFPLFKKGNHEAMEEVSLSRVKKAVVESKMPLPVNIDGEVLKESKVTFEILPGRIRMIIPNQA